MPNRYYAVTAACGHVGVTNTVYITFSVKARDGKCAAETVRCFPRVKHDHKDAILACREISYEEYLQLAAVNNDDAYLKCTSRRMQDALCDLTDRLHRDQAPRYYEKRTPEQKATRRDRIAYRKSKQQAHDFAMEDHEDYEGYDDEYADETYEEEGLYA